MKKCFAYLLTVAFLVLVGLSPVMADTQPQNVAFTISYQESAVLGSIESSQAGATSAYQTVGKYNESATCQVPKSYSQGVILLELIQTPVSGKPVALVFNSRLVLNLNSRHTKTERISGSLLIQI